MRKKDNLLLGINILVIISIVSVIGFFGFFPPSSTQYTNGRLLVDTNWLKDHINDPEIRIIDVRAYPKYLESHIPNAVHLNPEYLQTSKRVSPKLSLNPS